MSEKKHLVVLDVETTGTDTTGADHVIQFAAIKIDTEVHKIIDSRNYYIQPEGNYTVALTAYFKHKIMPAMLADKPKFKDVADDILDFLEGCDILTYNGVSFDLPILCTEFAKVGKEFSPKNYVCYDAYKEEIRRHSNKLDDTFTRYCGKTMEEAGLQAHDAFSDIKATYAIFRHQQKTSEVKPERLICDDNYITMQEWEGKEQPCFNSGKYRELPVELVVEIDMAYINWFLMNKHPKPSTVKIIRYFIDKRSKQQTNG